MGLPVILFLIVIGSLCLTSTNSQFLYPGYYYPQQASYFQPYIGNPFSDGRHIRRTYLYNNNINNGNPFQNTNRPLSGSLVKRKTSDSDERIAVANVNNNNNDADSHGRLLSSSAFSKISETLGALNTVGHFIVDMTRGQDVDSDESDTSQSVPDAILTLTKTVLGQNVTKTIEPLIKRVDEDNETNDTKKKRKKIKINTISQQPSVAVTLSPFSSKATSATSSASTTTTSTTTTTTTTAAPIPIIASKQDISSKEGENRCTTPDGSPGHCDDLSSCPALLLDLGSLRESLCFKSLFVPGVCCPIEQSTILTTQRPITLRPQPPPHRPQQSPPQSLVLLPQIRPSTTTERPPPPPPPPLPSGPILSSVEGGTSNELDRPINNIIDPEECGQQEFSSGRIVGGIEAPNGQWPWMAAIFLHGPKRTEFWCGGSLIGSRYILTAAHCTRDSRQKPFAARQFTVRLGDIDLSTDSEPSAPVTFNVKEVRAHERFSRVGFYNDVAILVLDRPVRKSKYVIPVCLPRPGFLPPRERLPGRRATVVGWGTTYYGGKESTVQRQADLPIWRNEDCDRSYFQPITDNFLCAGYSEGGVDACQGDSGGPLMMRIDARWTQLGIVSFGNKCGEPGYPGVYTRISEYIDWIHEHTRD